MIGYKDNLITKTMTFIAIKEGPSFDEEPFAFMFLNVKPHYLERAENSLLKIKQVISSDILLGPYDLIAPLRSKDRLELEKIISLIHKNVPGIEGATTAIIAISRK